MRQVEFVGIRIEQPQNEPLMLLQEIEGSRRYLPIWIGSVESTAIALHQQGVKPKRPLTHDLIALLDQELDLGLESIEIVDLVEGTFFADLVFADDRRVSCRPSDAVAIALRAMVPIYVIDKVLDEAGIRSDDAGEEQVEAFREFLDAISPEDFLTEGGPGGTSPGSPDND